MAGWTRLYNIDPMVIVGSQRKNPNAARPQLVVVLLFGLLIGLPTFSSSSTLLVDYGQDVIQPARELRLLPQIDHDTTLARMSQPPSSDDIDCHQLTCLALTFDDGPN